MSDEPATVAMLRLFAPLPLWEQLRFMAAATMIQAGMTFDKASRYLTGPSRTEIRSRAAREGWRRRRAAGMVRMPGE